MLVYFFPLCFLSEDKIKKLKIAIMGWVDYYYLWPGMHYQPNPKKGDFGF